MFERILVPLDGSPLAECVLPHAVALSRAFDAEMTLLRVLERSQATERAQSTDLLGWHIHKAEAESYLDSLVTRLSGMLSGVNWEIMEGRAAERITEFARDRDIDLIILSSHGRSGLSGWNISGVVQKIILRACMPIMIVRAYQSIKYDWDGLRYRRLMVPLDCSKRAECVLPLATKLARFHESEFLLAHVVCLPDMPRPVPLSQEEIALAEKVVRHNQKAARQCFKQLQDRLPIPAQIRLEVGDSAVAMLHDLVEQEKVDLVLLSAHGYSGGNRWPYGSVALNFIAYGTTPLLIVQDLSEGELESTQAEMAARQHKGH
ncbi:MAG TPA: universal stress protein [Chloroflexi bacterium]|nr:universal stress protein [Chloroflexota bacterium]